MAKTKQEEKLPEQPEAHVSETAVTVIDDQANLKSLFGRGINGGGVVKAINFKRTLAQPLIAMAHEKELVFTCLSEVYTMELPSKDRKAELEDVRVVDGVNELNAQSCTLMLNELMASAFARGGYRTMKPSTDPQAVDRYVVVEGNSIINKSFAFKEGIKREGKGYRAIDCVEVEITR